MLPSPLSQLFELLQPQGRHRVGRPTLGPSGRQERLNCCAKKRRTKVMSQCLMTAGEVSSAKVAQARR